MPPIEVGPAVLRLNGGQLSLQDWYKKIAAPARRLKKTGINALDLAFDEIEHICDEPPGCKYLPVIGNALPGLDTHEGWVVEID